MTDTEQTPPGEPEASLAPRATRRPAAENHRASLEAVRRRERALELAINYHVDTCIRDADYLRTVRSVGAETRTLTHRDVIATANAFDLFLMGQGPFVIEYALRAKAAAEPDAPAPEPMT